MLSLEILPQVSISHWCNTRKSFSFVFFEFYFIYLFLYSRFSLVIYFIHSINSVCMSIPISQFIPSPLSPLVSIHLFSSDFYYLFSSVCLRHKLSTNIWVSFRILNSMSLTSTSILMLVPHCLDYCSFIISFAIRKQEFSYIFLFFIEVYLIYNINFQVYNTVI